MNNCRTSGCTWEALRRPLLFVAVMAVAAPSFAQAPYVVAATGMDVSRFSHVEGMTDTQAEGQGAVFSVRLGARLGSRWGVELGFSRPTVVTAPAGFVALYGDGISASSAKRNTTLDTVVWVTQKAGERVDLVYLGGVAFARIVEDYR